MIHTNSDLNVKRKPSSGDKYHFFFSSLMVWLVLKDLKTRFLENNNYENYKKDIQQNILTE